MSRAERRRLQKHLHSTMVSINPPGPDRAGPGQEDIYIPLWYLLIRPAGKPGPSDDEFTFHYGIY